MALSLEQLQDRNLVWNGSDSIVKNQNTQIKSPTGYANLDEILDGGMPNSGVVEINSIFGAGELRIILPGLAKDKDQLLVFISPPAQVNPLALKQQGFCVNRVLVVRPKTHKDALWTTEQCLQSGCCNTVLFWPKEPLTIAQVKRFQYASKATNSRLFSFPNNHIAEALPVELSLTFMPIKTGVKVKINRRKGGWPSDYVNLNMQESWPYFTLGELLPDNVISFPIVKAS